MAKFQFRLATLQKLREAHRDEMRSKLSEAYQAERLLAERVQANQQEQAELEVGRRGALQHTETNVNQLLNAQRYTAVLKSELATLEQQSAMLVEEIEKRRKALVAADQQVRVLENLHERQLAEHQKELLREEAKVMDEIASRAREVSH